MYLWEYFCSIESFFTLKKNIDIDTSFCYLRIQKSICIFKWIFVQIIFVNFFELFLSHNFICAKILELRLFAKLNMHKISAIRLYLKTYRKTLLGKVFQTKNIFFRSFFIVHILHFTFFFNIIFIFLLKSTVSWCFLFIIWCIPSFSFIIAFCFRQGKLFVRENYLSLFPTKFSPLRYN